MTGETATPLRCQYPSPHRRCEEAPVFRLHHTVAPGGAEFTAVVCRGHADREADRIRREGGDLLAVEDVEVTT